MSDRRRSERGLGATEVLVATCCLGLLAGALFSALHSASRAERDLVLDADAQGEADRLLETVAGALRRASLGTVSVPGPGDAASEVRFREVRAIRFEDGLLAYEVAPETTAFWRTEAGDLVALRGGAERTIARGVTLFEVARLGATRAFRVRVEVERRDGSAGEPGGTRRVGVTVGEVLVEND